MFESNFRINSFTQKLRNKIFYQIRKESYLINSNPTMAQLII